MEDIQKMVIEKYMYIIIVQQMKTLYSLKIGINDFSHIFAHAT